MRCARRPPECAPLPRLFADRIARGSPAAAPRPSPTRARADLRTGGVGGVRAGVGAAVQVQDAGGPPHPRARPPPGGAAPSAVRPPSPREAHAAPSGRRSLRFGASPARALRKAHCREGSAHAVVLSCREVGSFWGSSLLPPSLLSFPPPSLPPSLAPSLPPSLLSSLFLSFSKSLCLSPLTNSILALCLSLPP